MKTFSKSSRLCKLAFVKSSKQASSLMLFIFYLVYCVISSLVELSNNNIQVNYINYYQEEQLNTLNCYGETNRGAINGEEVEPALISGCFDLNKMWHDDNDICVKKVPPSMLRPASAIRLIRLDAPKSVQAGQPITLRCLADSKRDRLQSLSWYKNGREFYRYQPFDRAQSVLVFNLTGINVDNTRSRNNTVFLTNTTSETSGRFKCEVTGLSFQEAQMETYINVITPGSGVLSLQNGRKFVNCLITIITTYIVVDALSKNQLNYIRLKEN